VWKEPVDEELIKSVLNGKRPYATDSFFNVPPAEEVNRLKELSGRDDKECSAALKVGRWKADANRYLSISTTDFERQMNEPVPCTGAKRFWFYRNRLVIVRGEGVNDELP
jgi:hypothetical protein